MIVGLLIGAVALGGGFVAARNFVRRRLRYVDAARKPVAPLLAGLAATAVVLPIAALPLVTIGTAVAFGVGVAGGAATPRRVPPASTTPTPPSPPPASRAAPAAPH